MTARAGAALLLGLALGTALSGCGGSAAAPVADRPASSPVVTPSPTTTTQEAPPADEQAAAPAGEGTMSVPAETAGDLSSSDVPAPPDLGTGWKQYADPGSPEEGYVGNGSWVRARVNTDVVQALLPLGCAGLTSTPRLPVPRHALEATYRGPGGAPAVALVLSYGSAAPAGQLLSLLESVGRSCGTPGHRVRPTDPLTTVVTQVRSDSTMMLDRRRELGAGASGWTWSEVVVRRGSRVGLLTVASAPRAAHPDLTALAAAVRASIGH